MADTTMIRVKEVKVEDRVSEKTKKPYQSLHIIDESGTEFNGFYNEGKTTLPEIGDTLKMTYQPVTLKSGTKFNIVSYNPSTEAPKAKVITKTTSAKTVTAPPTTSSFNNKGARTGGVLHDAVAIAIHNASIAKSTVNLGEVEALAEALLDLASRLEG